MPNSSFSQERLHYPTVGSLSPYSPPQSLPSRYQSPLSPLPQDPPRVGKPGVFIIYEIQDGVIRLSPTIEQWHEFPALLQYTRDLGAEEHGIYKVLIPEGVAGISELLRYTKQKNSAIGLVLKATVPSVSKEVNREIFLK